MISTSPALRFPQGRCCGDLIVAWAPFGAQRHRKVCGNGSGSRVTSAATARRCTATVEAFIGSGAHQTSSFRFLLKQPLMPSVALPSASTESALQAEQLPRLSVPRSSSLAVAPACMRVTVAPSSVGVLTAPPTPATTQATGLASAQELTSTVDSVSFRSTAQINGMTVVTDEQSARRAIEELQRLVDRVHAWDVECIGLDRQRDAMSSPVSSGRVICATCFCGDDADFGNGPRLFVDNDGPAAGILYNYFREYFEDARYQKIFHNFSFDAHLLRRHCITVKGFHADTLHMARLYDTALSAWEGGATKEMRQAKQAAEGGFQRGEGKTRRRVNGVSLGGRALSSSASLETSVSEGDGMKIVEGREKVSNVTGIPGGYGLKALSSYFGLVDNAQNNEFSELWGRSESASSDAHNSPAHFPAWVTYATNDAVLTHRLFNFVRSGLQGRPWLTSVHARPVSALLADKSVAAEMFESSSVTAQVPSYVTRLGTCRSMWDFYETYIRDFAQSLANMERVGLGVNLDRLRQIEEETIRDKEACLKDFVTALEALRGPDGVQLYPHARLINIKSSAQMQTLLFGGAGSNRRTEEMLPETRNCQVTSSQKARVSLPASSSSSDSTPRSFEIRGLGLQPSAKRSLRTSQGWPSVSNEALKELVGSERSPGPAKEQLLEKGHSETDVDRVLRGFRQAMTASRLGSLVVGFAKPLQKYGAATGRIHPRWAFDTATGRIACRKPNLQNLPRDEQDKYKLRDAFRADPGKTLIVADYSQLEIRILAHMTNCTTMIEKLTTGGDYHSEVAAEMFLHIGEAIAAGDVSIDKDGSNTPTVKARYGQERTQAKAVNFAIIYGKTPMSLGEDLGITTEEAEGLIEKWYRSKPEIRLWKEQLLQDARAHGRALSLLGRWRTLPLIAPKSVPMHRKRSERAAVNFAIQGSAADITIAAMLRITSQSSVESQRLADLGFSLVSQVHDEFVMEGPEESADEAKELLREMMSNPFKDMNSFFNFKLPLTVDVGVGPTFGSAKM
eukprot:TRINITY_DN2199_c0_g1_i2.p1 TRINITY_DN2199_c0_g1~~TRINITY_DN2199_c0_g1_i2.p1  ORF type:complete len:1037 (+),score=143.03 TRINITY_DN2199_c0_g1_i2:53-3112(+)